MNCFFYIQITSLLSKYIICEKYIKASFKKELRCQCKVLPLKFLLNCLAISLKLVFQPFFKDRKKNILALVEALAGIFYPYLHITYPKLSIKNLLYLSIVNQLY